MNKELFELLLKRLLDFSIIPDGQVKFIYAQTGGTLHEMLILNGLLTKPSWADFEAEEAIYNNEVAMAAEAAALVEAERLAEEERAKDWTTRLDMKHFREVMTSIGRNDSNDAIVKKEIIDNKDESVLIQYETAHETIAKSRTLQEDIELLYTGMVKDVYDSMQITFGTRNDISVAAFAATWEAMVKRPSSYVDIELGLLDTDAVVAFAESKIIAADKYAIFRMKRIALFQAGKEALINA